jgi:hypothetical protein
MPKPLNEGGFHKRTMALFDNLIEIPGHDTTLRQLDDILEDYQNACYATGKRVEQPHLKETAIKAIRALSPFYSESDAEKLLDRAVSKPRPGTPRKLHRP